MPVTRGFYGASRRIGVRKGNVFWTGSGFESFPYDKIKKKRLLSKQTSLREVTTMTQAADAGACKVSSVLGGDGPHFAFRN